jgi:DNA/RNA-binding domain of Phe-tRNA-synthetase-like protein
VGRTARALVLRLRGRHHYNAAMIRIDPTFSSVLNLGVLEVPGIQVRESPDELKAMIHALAETYTTRYKGTPLGEIPTVQEVRAIFHKSGVDPTRYRPSSESLLRRAVSGKGLYFINSVVDLVNYFSLKLLYPIGLYDADRLRPPLTLRVGRSGESYEGIGRSHLNLEGFPLLVDGEGPFGSPISDSMRTRVTDESRNILWLTFAPAGGAIPTQDFMDMMVRFNCAKI